jgi:hypothetical protein
LSNLQKKTPKPCGNSQEREETLLGYGVAKHLSNQGGDDFLDAYLIVLPSLPVKTIFREISITLYSQGLHHEII